MRYVITVEGFREASIARDTAFEAVAKAREMISAGIQGVQITDTKTYRTYEPDEFSLLRDR
jgi:hypothetical protein